MSFGLCQDLTARVAVTLLLGLLVTVTPRPSLALAPGQSLASAARELSHAPSATRAAFVEAAVTEIVAAHRALAARKGTDLGASRGWQSYLGRLQAAADAARAGADVYLVVEPDQTLRVVVGHAPARQFMVAAPRPDDHPRLERAILRRLCAADGCVTPAARAAASHTYADTDPAATVRILAPGDDGLPVARFTPPPKPADTGLPALPFKAEPPAPRLLARLPSGADGLGCAGDEVRHRVLYDRACQALLKDARALAAALHAAALRGVVIDWGTPAQLRSEAAAQVLAINARGEVVRLPLPALAQAPELLVDVLAWAHGRLYGKPAAVALRPPAYLVYGAAVAAR